MLCLTDNILGQGDHYEKIWSETGEHGAVYLWESDAALKEFRESELGRTISTAYQIQGASDVQIAEVVMTLRPT